MWKLPGDVLDSAIVGGGNDDLVTEQVRLQGVGVLFLATGIAGFFRVFLECIRGARELRQGIGSLRDDGGHQIPQQGSLAGSWGAIDTQNTGSFPQLLQNEIDGQLLRVHQSAMLLGRPAAGGVLVGKEMVDDGAFQFRAADGVAGDARVRIQIL